RKAIALQPDYALAHYNLGGALREQGRVVEAEAAYRKAIALQPDHAEAHDNLGTLLLAKKKLDDAAAAFRKAIQPQSDSAEPHCNLGHTLLGQGRFADALAALRRGHELGRHRPNWPYPSAQWVREARRWVALDARLPKVLSGQAHPADAGERIAL